MATEVQKYSGGQAFRLPQIPMNESTATWERLEALRLQRLGLPNKYSRHFNVLRQSTNNSNMPMMKDDPVALGRLTREYTMSVVTGSYGKNPSPGGLIRSKTDVDTRRSNSLAPFATVGKPTCGFFFSRGTDNRKIKFGIPASDLVKWRHFGNQH